jgi:hypothetical protein
MQKSNLKKRIEDKSKRTPLFNFLSKIILVPKHSIDNFIKQIYFEIITYDPQSNSPIFDLQIETTFI